MAADWLTGDNMNMALSSWHNSAYTGTYMGSASLKISVPSRSVFEAPGLMSIWHHKLTITLLSTL